jgi:hypothetical protein
MKPAIRRSPTPITASRSFCCDQTPGPSYSIRPSLAGANSRPARPLTGPRRQSVPTPGANSGMGAPEACGLGCRFSALLSRFRICNLYCRIVIPHGATPRRLRLLGGGGAGGAGAQSPRGKKFKSARGTSRIRIQYPYKVYPPTPRDRGSGFLYGTRESDPFYKWIQHSKVLDAEEGGQRGSRGTHQVAKCFGMSIFL